MKVIDKRIGNSAVGGIFIAIGVMKILNQPIQQDWIFAVIFLVMGIFLIYKGRYF